MSRFSRRLPWITEDNALAALEARLRAERIPILDLTASNPTAVGLGADDQDVSRALMQPGIARYEPAPLGPLGARAAIAASLDVPVANVALTASSSESYAYLFKLLCDPGDVVLVPQPSYPLFEYLARLEGVATRPYQLAWTGEWHIDWSSVDVAGARAFVVVNPNNPTGSYLRAGDAHTLQARAAEAGVAIISDEVFAPYPAAPRDDAVRTLATPASAALTFCLGGLSKSCGLPGLKLGWIAATGPDAMVREALTRLELIADTYLSVSSPVANALPQLLAVGAEVRARISARVTRNRAHLTAALAALPATVLPAEAGWSAIVRLPSTRTDEAWALELLERHHALVHPGYFFDLHLGATIVISLLPEASTFTEAVRRIVNLVTTEQEP